MIIWEELPRNAVPLVWMDAGNILRRTLRRYRRELRRDGFTAHHSPGTLRDWTHPGTLHRLALSDDFDPTRQNLSAALLGFDPSQPKVRDLAADWAHHAADRGCIAPEGSDRSNHRQDQALLGVLAYRSGIIDAPTKPILFRGKPRIEVMIQKDLETPGG